MKPTSIVEQYYPKLFSIDWNITGQLNDFSCQFLHNLKLVCHNFGCSHTFKIAAPELPFDFLKQEKSYGQEQESIWAGKHMTPLLGKILIYRKCNVTWSIIMIKLPRVSTWSQTTLFLNSEEPHGSTFDRLSVFEAQIPYAQYAYLKYQKNIDHWIDLGFALFFLRFSVHLRRLKNASFSCPLFLSEILWNYFSKFCISSYQASEFHEQSLLWDNTQTWWDFSLSTPYCQFLLCLVIHNRVHPPGFMASNNAFCHLTTKKDQDMVSSL